MNSAENAHKTLLDGEITIYTLDTTAAPIWQCRFKNPLGKKPRYIRKSLKTKNEAIAIKKAMELYQEYNTRSHLGLVKGAMTIEELWNHCRGNMRKVWNRSGADLLETMWTPYFGNRDITKINDADINEYFDWRIQQLIARKSASEDGTKSPTWVASTKTVNVRTLRFELQILRSMFRTAYNAQLVPRNLLFDIKLRNKPHVHTLPSNLSRGRFNHDQYKVLMQEFTTISKALDNHNWKPVLTDPELPWNKVNNPWISICTRDKKGHDKREERNKVFCSKQARYSKSVFWFAGLLMANTGIRPVELVKLRHSDIELRETPDGQMFTVIHISKQVSKIRDTRLVISADGAATYKRYLKYKQELEYYFNEEIDVCDDRGRFQNDGYLFPQPVGPNKYKAPRKYLNIIFRDNLKELGLHTSEVVSDENHVVRVFYSAYSFRSWYINQRLHNGLDPFTLAKQCGVSMNTLIESYDVTDTWVYRNEMIKHIKGTIDITPTKEDRDLLKDHAVQFID